jgi:arylsulfatase A-like enzyme
MPRLVPLLATLTACAGTATTPPAEAISPWRGTGIVELTGGAPHRNVLLLSFDTLDIGQLGRYGGEIDVPFLDGIADASVELTAHTSCSSWTLPSLACAVSGRDPEEIGQLYRIEDGADTDGRLPADTPVLSEWLEEAGIAAAVVAANAYLAKDRGTVGRDADVVKIQYAVASEVNSAGLRMFDDGALDTEKPWALHLHYMDPHLPYAPPEEYREGLEDYGEWAWDLTTQNGAEAASSAYATMSTEEQTRLRRAIQVLYFGEIRYLFDQVELLWAELDGRGLLDDTLVVMFTDHGEQLWQHGARGHALSLFRQETDALGLLWAKDIVPVTWAGPTGHRDLPPTILDAMGLPIPAEITGASAGTAADDGPLFSTLWPAAKPPRQSIRVGNRKLLYYWEDGRKQLFDLAADPNERTNLYVATDPDVISMWELLMPRVDMLRPIVTDSEPISPGP